MARRRPHDDLDDDEQPRGPPDRTWSTRLAWLTLVGGAAVVLTRLSVATVIQVHGDGMAPTILDRDHVLLVRSGWTLQRGDIVVYDPVTPPADAEPADPKAPDTIRAPNDEGRELPDPQKEARGDLRNTAVVDREELDANWERVQNRSEGLAGTLTPRPLRIGRVLAVPGDRVSFHVPGAALGLSIDGQDLQQKPNDSIKIAVMSESGVEAAAPRLRPTAYEMTGDRRYLVLEPGRPNTPSWSELDIPPPSAGPVEVLAEGYLVVADNRAQGACCDSRAIGWVAADQIRGEVVMRLSGDPAKTPDLDPAARGLQWKP